MIRKLNKMFRDKKGMTLIEVVVASAMSCIILTCALGLFLPLNKSITTNKNLSDAKMIAANIIFEIEQSVQYAKTITIDDAATYPSGITTKAIYQVKTGAAPNEVIQTMYTSTGSTADEVDVVGKGFYDKLDYKVFYSQAIDSTTTPPTKKPALKVQVKVYKKGTSVLVYDITNTIRPLNTSASSIIDNSTSPVPPGNYQYITFS